MDNTFGAWLGSEMERRGWSQRELGRRIGRSQSAVQRVVCGLRAPSVEFSLLLAGALEMPADEILRRAGHLPPLTNADDLGPRTCFLLEQAADKLRLLERHEQVQVTDWFLEFVDFALSLKGLEEPAEAG